MEQQQDSAISICTSLLTHDSVRNNAAEQENIYDMLNVVFISTTSIVGCKYSFFVIVVPSII